MTSITSLDIVDLALLAPLILLIQGIFSGAEIALLSADKSKLSEKATVVGSWGARAALALAARPERLFSVTLVITNSCVVLLSILVAIVVRHRIGQETGFLSVAIVSPLVVLFGELFPKTLLHRHADRLAPWVSYPISLAYWLFFPVTRLLAAYTQRVSSMVGPIESLTAKRKRSIREVVRSILRHGRRETDLRTTQKTMIKRIFDFSDAEAKHALIPLVRVNAIDESSTIKEAIEMFEKHRHYRMPIFSERIDNVVGILEVADLFSARTSEDPVGKYMKPAIYATEVQALEEVLFEMKSGRNEMVIVVDEYGGAVGILTYEDIVEEVVGDIRDEDEPDSVPYKELGERRWLLQGKTKVKTVNELLRIELPEGDYETVGGFLLQQFGRIPSISDELFIDTPAGSLKFVIRNADRRRIHSVMVALLEPKHPAEG